ncbi:hypothetical protein [Flavobacterium collinsii]|uniref:Uncharacterized protein n=1 Tax=Flavobacterium collinsii TaxID=1114861 RepID=A0A9W4X481_9FLAO|nr:hypothetical protein [Flavobacterium collinsii]CAI2768160.1 conserved protein of unknown function [Flavobacterium collinsii]
MKTVAFTRLELYDLVWKKPMGQISRLYGISSYGIRQACAAMKVPLPHASYWIQLKHGYSWTDKLPEPYEGPEFLDILKKKYETDIPVPAPSPLVVLTREIENDPKAPLKVPAKLTNPHRLIQITKESWDKRDKKKSYREPDPQGLYLHMTDADMPRALRFMDALIKLLEYRGHEFQKNQYGHTVAVVDGIEIEADLREAARRVPAKDGYGTELVGTGAFIFRVGKYSDQKEWKDGSVLLEELLARITAKLELMAKEKKQRQEESRLRLIEREKEQAIVREAAQRREQEMRDFKKLLADAERYDQAERLRRYVQQVEDQGGYEKQKQWLDWAKAKINWMDPLVNEKDAIFTDNDLKEYLKW